MSAHTSGGLLLPNPQEVLAWAEFYAFQMGWVIMPIHQWTGLYSERGGLVCSCELTGKRWGTCNPEKPGKHPWVGWKQTPMETPEQGYAAWRGFYDQYGAQNGVAIGVRTGAVSGFFAIDLDVGGLKNGVGNFESWMAKASLSWNDLGTLSAQTGGGGYHLLYKYPKGVEKIPTLAGHPDLGQAVDVKGDGGYILVTPSVHASGRTYVWRPEIPIAPGAIAEAPKTLVEAVRTKTKNQYGNLALENYTPSLEELKDYAETLNRKKGRSKQIGSDMAEALIGKAIGEVGTRHNSYRDVLFVIRKQWPRCDRDEILPYFYESIREWFPDEDDFSITVEDLKNCLGVEEKDPIGGWTKAVALNDIGRPLATDANIVLFFENHPAWKDVLGYNLRTNRPVYLKKPPISLGVDLGTINMTRDRSWISLWLQDKTQMAGRINGSDIQSALIAVASRHSFDPLRELLLALRGTWDGVERLPFIFQRVAGTPDSAWARLVGTLWFKSLVARILYPGCKCDTMLILEGPQGYRKSSFFDALLPDSAYFSDSLNRVKHDVESVRLIHSGPAIFEVGELSGLRKQEVEEIKAFLSSREDDLRPLYEAHKRTPRRCVFVGTTNRDDYLRDETGGRRFWPIKVGQPIDLPTVFAERVQWFAEAFWRVENGEHWYLDDERGNTLAAVEQDERYEEDIWFGVIRDFLSIENRSKKHLPTAINGTQQMEEMLNNKKAGDFITTMNIAEHALKIEVKNARSTEGIRINKILRKLGWTPSRTNKNRGWARPDAIENKSDTLMMSP